MSNWARPRASLLALAAALLALLAACGSDSPTPEPPTATTPAGSTAEPTASSTTAPASTPTATPTAPAVGPTNEVDPAALQAFLSALPQQFLELIPDDELQCLVTEAGGNNELMAVLEEDGFGADLVQGCVRVNSSIDATLQVFAEMPTELLEGGEAERSALMACLNDAFEPMRNESRLLNDPAVEAELDAMNEEYNACFSQAPN